MNLLLCGAVYTSLMSVLPEVFVGPHPMVRGTLVGVAAHLVGPARTSPQARFDPPQWPGTTLTLLRMPIRGGRPELFDVSTGGGGWWRTRGGLTPVRWLIADGHVFWAHLSDAYGGPLQAGAPPRTPTVSVLCSYPLTANALDRCRVSKLDVDLKTLYERYAATTEVSNAAPQARIAEFSDLFNGDFGTHKPLPPADRWRAHFDFAPNPSGKPELYVIAPNQLFRYHSRLDAAGIRPIYRWERVADFVPGWDGPFYVAADGDDRHFVVPGGRVFTLPADAKPGSALVKTWDNGPILALVHDADAGKSYAFTRTHYFHVTAKPAPKPHGLKAFPGATGEEALDTVAKCGRVIRGLK